MKVYILKREQFVNRPLKEVFAFFERPENLMRLTPDSLGFNVLTPSPIQMKEGALIDYTIKLLFSRCTGERSFRPMNRRSGLSISSSGAPIH